MLEMSQKLQSHQTLIIGNSKQSEQMRVLAGRLGKTNHTVLITGETGTGKEVVAKEIHMNGRQDKPFIPVNCSAITDTLFESELFGHKKGAFTGAEEDRIGFFESAQDGTIFLDEVGTLPIALQVKLLRVFQNRIFNPVGDRRQIQMKARVITATNIDLLEAVEKKEFREDLFHRLHVIPFTVSPLRDRAEDIPLLVNHFLNGVKKIIPEAMSVMINYDWPGNIRELEHAVMRAVFFSAEEKNIQVEHILPYLKKEVHENTQIDNGSMYKRNGEFLTLEEVKVSYLNEVLKYTNGNILRTAGITGIEYRSLQRMVDNFNLNRRKNSKK